MHDVTRRGILTAAAASAAGFVDAAVHEQSVDPHPAQSNVLRRIAFGSCADQDKEQPIWDAILAAKPDLFIFLGDNIYGDTEDMTELRARYAKLASKPGFIKLRETVPIAAIWDDHDYGADDSGAEYPRARESKQIFLEFFGEAAASPRWARDGAYASYLFGPSGRRVQLIMPDLRTHRAPLKSLSMTKREYRMWAAGFERRGEPVPGPKIRNPDPQISMMDERQWRWLENCLKTPADVRVFCSSIQVLADFPGWEAWVNYTCDHQRLIELIRTTKASGVVFISGDTHYGEISRLDVNVPYTLWDITSSGLTETWPVLPPNVHRVGDAVRENNFGVIEIGWDGPAPKLQAKVCQKDGVCRIDQALDLAELVVA